MYPFTQYEILSFERIAFAHNLVANNYRYTLDNEGYGIYGQTPEYGGVLEIGFVEQNPIILRGESGEFLIKENCVFIIPPDSRFSVQAQETGLHRHTSVEFLVRCRCQKNCQYQPPEGRKVTLPLVIPPSQRSNEGFEIIRTIIGARAIRPERSFFEECADFMLLMHKLNMLVQEAGGTDTVTPGNRRYCDRAKTYISGNLHHRITVGEVADAIGVSKNYLTNVFSSSEGIPLMEYINRRKLSYMLELMRRYHYTLAQAGEHVGYNDVNYISRIFKRYYGVTITQYRQNLDNGITTDKEEI